MQIDRRVCARVCVRGKKGVRVCATVSDVNVVEVKKKSRARGLHDKSRSAEPHKRTARAAIVKADMWFLGASASCLQLLGYCMRLFREKCAESKDNIQP